MTTTKKYSIALVLVVLIGLFGLKVVLNQGTTPPQTETPDRPVVDLVTPSEGETEQPAAPVQPPVDEPVAETKLPVKINITVPFTSQAPFGDWDDQRQQDGCEEASTLMAARWITGESLNPTTALAELMKIFSWEVEAFGASNDTNAADTARILTDYFKVPQVTVSRDVSVASIRSALASGKVVIVPTDGQALGNPYFSGDGPERHMLIIIGYDDSTKRFIVNDPGTKRGASYQYNYDVLFDAIREYPSGVHQPIVADRKAMIIVAK
ncbi:MAG: C39 family peptidase [Patescibacteria group bacterium]